MELVEETLMNNMRYKNKSQSVFVIIELLFLAHSAASSATANTWLHRNRTAGKFAWVVNIISRYAYVNAKHMKWNEYWVDDNDDMLFAQ